MKRYLILGIGGVGILSLAFFLSPQQMNTNELGLRFLTWVKKLKGDGVDLNALSGGTTTQPKHQVWSDLLATHVDVEGRVNYKGFQRDVRQLDMYLEDLSSHPPGEPWSRSEKLAYWINAYNAFTIKLILDHYPLESIKDIADGLPMIHSPWDIKFFAIGGVAMDLNTIEHEILRKKFNEPRIHFAINCASISCPKLRDEAYTAEKLEQQVEEQARDFINDPTRNRITEKEISLSKIFDWFQYDFTRQTDLLDFIQRYKPSLNEDLAIGYMEYDWGLNE